LEAEGAPVWQYRMYSRLREGKNGVRGKLVVVDPRFSITAAKADKWIPINPGTEAALALGIAYVLVQEELYDKLFVEQYTFGFDDWKDKYGTSHLGFRSLVLKNYYPEAVSTITGVPIEDIFRIARGFAAHQPGVAVCGKGVDAYSNGFYTQLAVHSLNALVGNLERAGGILQATEPPFAPLPQPTLDNEAEANLHRVRIDEAGTARFPFAFDVPSALPQNILNGHPYDVQLLFLYNSNPLFESPSSALWRQSFEKVPLIVGIASFINESTELADLLLPEHTYLERWGDEWGSPNVGFPHFGLRRPVVNPLHDTRHAGDMIIAMAKKFGPPLSQAFPFDDYLSMMKYSVERLFESGRGAIISATFEEAMMEYLKERGWRYPGPKTFEEFWKSLVENGGWFDTIGPQGPLQHVFQTPSKKFEFYLQRVEETLEVHAAEAAKNNRTSKEQEFETLLQALDIQGYGDEVFLPHYEEADFAGNESLFPFYLKLFHVNTLMDNSTANTPAMLEMVGSRNSERWNSWVEINPGTAAKLGINDGDTVWVESSIGKLKTKAKLFVGAMPGVVNIPLGMGHTVGRFAKRHGVNPVPTDVGIGVNPMELLATTVDPLSGVSAIFSTRVKVYKA
jgi:anaerobic selenocysteine-containing dehydrogenase